MITQLRQSDRLSSACTADQDSAPLMGSMDDLVCRGSAELPDKRLSDVGKYIR